MKIEEAKNRCNELIKVEQNCWIGISNQNAIKSLLNELDNKDKIIIAMAEQLTTPVHGIDWVIDYFTKKVEGN